MNYLWDDQHNLFQRLYHGPFAYSDGVEVEDRLYDIVAGAQDRSTFSSELAGSITDWPTEYHLSRFRHGLLRPLGIPAGSKVLELGCGCGAITRYLGEIGADVVAVEGSLPRARVAAERCRDLPNVRVFVDDLLQFETDERFDFVLLIGVLEYAAVFSRQENPFTHYLRSVTSFLASGGRVVVAIENKLGLKYFNGCAEDHLGSRFLGIQDLYGPKTARTFGRRELIAQLSAAGLSHTYFYYPFPDYKLPSVVLSQEALSDPEFNAGDLLARSHARDYTGSQLRSFDDALAFSVLHDNGLLADLSNSFMVVATADSGGEIAPVELATAFSVYRAPELCVQTKFVRCATHIRVLKEPLTSPPPRPVLIHEGLTIIHRMEEAIYRPGRQLLWRLLKARARTGDLESVVEALGPWMEFLLQQARVPTARLADVSGRQPELCLYEVPGKFLDCSPSNLLEAGDELIPIDLEWQTDHDLSLGWVVTRGVLWSLGCGLPSDDHLGSVGQVVEALCQRSGLSVSNADTNAWLDLEAAFQTAVTERQWESDAIQRTSSQMKSFGNAIAALERVVLRRDEQIGTISHQTGALTDTLAQSDQQIASLSKLVSRLDAEIAQVSAERDRLRVEASEAKAQATERREQLNSLVHSRTWRWTAPLRAAAGLKPNHLRSRRQLKRDARLLMQSGFFDPEWYLSHNLDVAVSGEDPLVHYLLRGGAEGRDPSPGFNGKWYLEQNLDVLTKRLNPLVHYLRFGIGEGRKPVPSLISSLPEAQKHWDQLGRSRLRQLLQGSGRLSFPVTDAPDVSIILVFYNKAHLSLLCLDSVLENADIPYEVVIINNSSSDETSQLMERLYGATIINNTTNCGFGPACNQGAEAARGEYLCFLNNDALLQPRALSVAVGNFREDPQVGAVGGKILLANGDLQEAGSILWSDGSAFGYGRGENPNLPQYDFRRPVDYCSGAFLFTPRSLFHELGRFSHLFGKAYYEDTDYCLEVWKAGFHVIYEPRAVIRHYESASSNGNEAAKSAMAANQQIFRENWKAELSKHLPSSSFNILAARIAAGSEGLNILYIDDRIPHRHLGAGFPRSVEILRSLVKLGHHVTCSTFTFPLQDNEYSDIPRDVELIDGTSQRQRLFRQYVPNSDIIWVSRPHNMKAFRQEWDTEMRNTKSHLIYDAEAIFSERDWLKEKTLGHELSEEVLATWLSQEADLAKRADAIVVVSERDRATMMQVGVENVYVVGHRLELKPTPAGFDSRRTFLFVGAMHGTDNPNADSMRYFCKSSWPVIHSLTGAELIIAGYGTKEALDDLIVDGVRILGQQENLTNLYNQARVFVVPTRYSAGIPLKALEAAAYGVPLVVSSLIGVQLGWHDGTDLLIAESDVRFAEECCSLYQDVSRWEQLRSNALTRAGRELSQEAFGEAIANLISEVSLSKELR